MGSGQKTEASFKKISPGEINLPRADAPVVSIVIPVFNKLGFTLNCLAHLAQIESRFSYEVIVVDNASSDKTSQQLPRIANLVYVRNQKNLGFGSGCNEGAARARGKYIVFLNNDTEVLPGWLDSLIAPMEQDNSIGIVGSKLIYPDGSLQEAGGIIFADASGLNYGRDQDPSYFPFSYRRDVDYCSAASIAIPTKLFKDLGGFDKLYEPAYYEDTDLAFRVRAKGLRVIYQPRSQLLHFEGKTGGTNTASGFKRYQVVNREKFQKRWTKVLQKDHYPPEEWYKGRDRSGDKLALVIEDRIPTPDKDSGSQRLVRLIGILQEEGYKVTLWPKRLEYEPKYTEALQDMGVEVVYGNVDFRSFSIQFGRYYDLVVLSRPYVAATFLEACRAWYYNAELIYDTVDLHFLRTQRQAEYEPKNAEGLLHHASLYKELEIGLARRVDATLVVSDIEKQQIQQYLPEAEIVVVSNIHEVVDEAYENSFDDRKDLVFIGGFDHLPNQDGIKWFCQDIFPIIRQKLPNLKLVVVGANMPKGLETSLKRISGVEVLGYVEDVTPIFSKVRIFVCPLRYGAGVKGKLGQAIEYGIPIVTTTIGSEGMRLDDGKSCLVADDPEDFAQSVYRLYSDKKLWQSVRKNALDVLKQHFSISSARQALTGAIRAGRTRTRPGL